MVAELEKIIAESGNIVFFGGAGVSTESGIPDFRSVDGLYHQKYDYPPEEILSHTFWEENPEEFYRFYRDKLIVKGAKPNAAHLRLARLEKEGKLKAVITQNIDGLHQAAGTQLLPDSQMDRFMVRLSMGYPSPKDEAAMVLNRQGGNPLHDLIPLMTREDLTAIQDTVEETYLSDSVVNYIVSLIGATRSSPDILRGASPRATLAVTAMAKSVARLRGRDYVTPADVKEVFAHTIAHRLILSPKAEAQGKQPQAVLQDILAAVPAPRLR